MFKWSTGWWEIYKSTVTKYLYFVRSTSGHAHAVWFHKTKTAAPRLRDVPVSLCVWCVSRLLAAASGHRWQDLNVLSQTMRMHHMGNLKGTCLSNWGSLWIMKTTTICTTGPLKGFGKESSKHEKTKAKQATAGQGCLSHFDANMYTKKGGGLQLAPTASRSPPLTNEGPVLVLCRIANKDQLCFCGQRRQNSIPICFPG